MQGLDFLVFNILVFFYTFFIVAISLSTFRGCSSLLRPGRESMSAPLSGKCRKKEKKKKENLTTKRPLSQKRIL